MEKENIASFAKRKGFVFQSSDIYNGFSGVFDYGPNGVELINNIKKKWWETLVFEREDIVGIDSAIHTSPIVWDVSGHTSNFADPIVYCRETGQAFRADTLLNEIGIELNENTDKEEFKKIFNENKHKLKLKNINTKNLTDVSYFNLLVESSLSKLKPEMSGTYLRGETCQGIYINFKNILDSMNLKPPFGIAQIGKAFRNEISPRQFLFRTREFEQMEMEYFCKEKDADGYFELFKKERFDWLINTIGLNKNNLRIKKHENLVFYAKDAVDIEYNYSFGWKELEGIHNRGNYDLKQHSNNSKIPLNYKNVDLKEDYIPFIIETSIGLGRLFYAILEDSYTVEELKDGTQRIVLKLNKDIAPNRIAILPLTKDEKITKIARNIFNSLKKKYKLVYDENQSIGKRYRRQDEIGTPYCLTIDPDTLNDNQITIRDRDTMEQKRVKVDEIEKFIC